jgi:hypothetical protein
MGLLYIFYYNNIRDKREKKILNQIKEKLDKNKDIISRAGKGNSTVVISQDSCHEKNQ